MDPKRRAAIKTRQDSLRQKLQLDQQLVGLEDLKAGLSAAGESFEIYYLGQAPSWTPAWIPRGYSRVPWELIPPAEETWFGDDLAARDEAFLIALSRRAEPDDPLLFVFEGRAASLGMAAAVAGRHIGLIFDRPLAPLWVTSPPSQWLIEVSGQAVRVGEPAGS